MKRKPVEDIIHELREKVSDEFFKLNPLKVFPDDFLSDEVKKDLAKPIDYPNLFEYEQRRAREARVRLEKKRSKRQAGKGMYRYQRFETSGLKPRGDNRYSEEMMDRMERLLPKLGRPKKKITLEEIEEMGKLMSMVDLITKAKYVEVLLPPGEKMKLWAEKKFGIYFEKSKIFKEFASLEEAKYVLYSRKKNQLMYKVPKDEAAVKLAVAEYEKYMGQTREGLVKAFMRQRVRKEAAEEMTRQIMKEKTG